MFTRGASAWLRSTRPGGELSCAQVEAHCVWEFPRSSTIIFFRCNRSFPLKNSLQMCYVNWKKTRELQSDYVMKNVFCPGFLVPEPAAAESDQQIETWHKRRQTRHHTRVPDRSDGAASRLDAYMAGKSEYYNCGIRSCIVLARLETLYVFFFFFFYSSQTPVATGRIVGLSGGGARHWKEVTMRLTTR